MARRPEPIARIRLARSVRRLLVLPLLFVIAGAALAAFGLVGSPPPVGLALAVVGGALAMVGVAWAAWLLSLRLDVEEAAIRLHWIAGERRYPLVAGPVTRVRFRGENASRIRARTGILGWQLGAATLRDEEEIHVVRLAPTPSAILVPTERGRLAIAPTTEADLLDALTRAARERQRMEEEAAAGVAPEPPPDEATEEEPEVEPPPMTGIERALLEERLAAERAAAEAGGALPPDAQAELAASDIEAAMPAPVEPVPVARRARLHRPSVARLRVPRPRPSSILVVLPLVGASAAWGIGLVTGRMPPPETDIARLTALGLVLAGPATSVAALMALAWWPRLVGVVVAGGLVASVLVGRVLLG